jgi:hypothetical protein
MNTLEDNKKYIIDNNGQVLTEINPGDRIKTIRKESLEFLERQRELQEWNIIHFYKGNIDEIKQLNEDLTNSEMGILFAIIPYINYDDCCLKFENGKELGFDDMISLGKLSRGKTSEVLNELRKKDVIYKGLNSEGLQYFVNPWLFCKGNKIDKVLKTMFKNYRIRIKQNQKWDEIEEK